MELLRRLSNAPGVSGYEKPVQAIVRDELAKHADEIHTDRLGNVIALKRATDPPSGTARRLLYAAHADEIGLMVSHIDERGFMRFVPVGGIDPRILPSQRVTIHGTKAQDGTIEGIIPPLPNWMSTEDDRKRLLPISELFIDTGLPADEVRRRVHVGDVVTFTKEFEILNDQVVTGRNFDDRIGTYTLIEAFARIDRSAVDVYAVSTVQEEVGTRGIPTASNAIQADICVAIDGSLPADVPYAKPHQKQCAMGEGTGIYIMDNRTIGDVDLINGLIATCEQHEIPFQRNIGGGTDASIVQRLGAGAKATTIGAPTRYMHSTVQLCHVRDIQATIDLLAYFPRYADGILPADWR